MKKSELQADQTIDPLQLDLECTLQPERFSKWADRSVEARAEADRAKLELDRLEAELQLRARKGPDEFGLEKATEKSIEAAVKSDHRYLRQAEKLIDARREYGLLAKAVDTMEMKKRMLESLITLHGQQYFAGPTTPNNLAAAYHLQREQSEKRVIQKQKTKIRRRKRK